MKSLFLFLVTGASVLAASCAGTIKSPDHVPVEKLVSDRDTATAVKVMSYNIHHCNPPSKPNLIDVDAIVHAIREQNPDLLALQEVDVHTERSGAVNQAEEIAGRLNMHFFFGKAIDHQGGAYGVAILSKFPLSEAAVHRLPTKAGTSGEPRVLATAKVTLPDGTSIRFGSTHLDAQRDSVNRQMQIGKIAEIASSEPLPFIIAGDFNATPETGVIGLLDKHFTRTCQSCAPTIPVTNPSKAIDFIAYNQPSDNFTVASHKVVDERYASDHLPVVAVIYVEK
jgi:endonuclease/exonuclease/phosphatase family metal-dependent hydrolase